MKFWIEFSPAAREQFHGLSAYDRAKIRSAIDLHLAAAPVQESKSRIKRLRDVAHPQYRMRVDDLRVFYDVEGRNVSILGIVEKKFADQWLNEWGVQ